MSSQEPTYSVKLTDKELLLLDARCSPEAQKEVDLAKKRVAIAVETPQLDTVYSGFLVAVNEVALKKGVIRLRHVRIRYCNLCKKDGGYAPHKRTRYGSYGAVSRKGDPNSNKPLYLNGWDLEERCISIQGYANLGCCDECYETIKPYLIKMLAEQQVEVDPRIMGHPSKWLKAVDCKCVECGWAGHELQMTKIPAMMGGFYRGGCPSCGKYNGFLGKTIVEKLDTFRIIPATEVVG